MKKCACMYEGGEREEDMADVCASPLSSSLPRSLPFSQPVQVGFETTHGEHSGTYVKFEAVDEQGTLDIFLLQGVSRGPGQRQAGRRGREGGRQTGQGGR